MFGMQGTVPQNMHGVYNSMALNNIALNIMPQSSMLSMQGNA